MICPQCNNGLLCPSLPKAITVAYRGFTKVVGSKASLDCSSCLYEGTESYNDSVDIDAEFMLFKREINIRLSGGLEL